MIFKRFYDDGLAQASYLIACEKTREAIVVDPNADIGQYARAAGAERLRITGVAETHVHADFLSGARELADAAGATLHLSAEGGALGYDPQALTSANRLRDGSRIDVGNVRMTVSHTPGHTPEHLSFILSDMARGDEPVGALTGDFIFVGDVGRPDLLEKAAGVAGTMDSSARSLFQSLRRFRGLPDHLQLWPGHGAGSACGKSLDAMPQSTLGYEKLFNWAFADMPEDAFVARVLENQPVPPRYFATMKRLNRQLASRPKTGQPPLKSFDEIPGALARKATVVDTRTADRFALGHIPGTINIPLGRTFLNWVGALVAETDDLYLLVESDSEETVKSIVGDLCKIGMTNVAGYFISDAVHEWKTRYGSVETVAQLAVSDIRARAGNNDLQIVDVRSPDEWSRGHLPGAKHIPLAALPSRLDELDASTPIVVQCQGGGRSSIAASLLLARGMTDVSNLSGGYNAWKAEGLPTEAPAASGDAKPR